MIQHPVFNDFRSRRLSLHIQQSLNFLHGLLIQVHLRTGFLIL
jgi:hypothetical protein